MGSLVPGWEAEHLGVPTELQDVDETEEFKPKGYFAKLESKRLERKSREGVGAAGTSTSFSRADQPRLTKTVSEHVDPHSKYVPTHWEEELNTLRTAQSSRYAADVMTSAKKPVVEKHHGWWQSMEGSALNVQHAEVEEERHRPGKDHHESFTPQFGVTGGTSLGSDF